MTDIDTRIIEIGERLKIARKNAGLSQSQVASLSGLSRPLIVAYEQGKVNIAVQRIFELAAIYECSEAWLLIGINPYFDAQKFVDEVAPVSEQARDDLHKLLGLLETLHQEPLAEDAGA